VDVHPDAHVGVSQAAELGALPEDGLAFGCRFVGFEVEVGQLAGDNVAFAVEGRHPEAVDDVGRRHRQVHLGVGGDVEFVGGVQGSPVGAERLHVLELPPPLVAGNVYVEDVGGIGDLAQDEDAAHRGDRHDGQDHGGQDGPADLEPGVAVELARLAVVALALPKPEDGDEQQGLNDDEHADGQPEHQIPQAVDAPGVVALRFERRLRACAGARAEHQRGRRDHRRPQAAVHPDVRLAGGCATRERVRLGHVGPHRTQAHRRREIIS
jgi:hypothetical protein